MYCTGDCLPTYAPKDDPRGQTTASEHHEAAPSDEHFYEPLENGQVRIIRIPAQSSASTSLSIELLVADIVVSQGLRLALSRETVAYTALSYCWQKDSDYINIVCNNRRLTVPGNIVEALLFLQHLRRDTFVWIDAICINQSDSVEKAAQVVMMFDIYLKARQVTAWLGGAADDSDLAMSILAQPDVVERLGKVTGAHQPRCQAYLEQTHAALIALYDKRSYLRRTWIRQELFAARQILFVCGRQELASSLYLNGDKVLRSIHKHMVNSRSAQTKVIDCISTALENAGDGRREGSRWPVLHDLKHILAQAQSYETSLEQDTVYAILQMCGVATTSQTDQECGHHRFLIDYERSPHQLYQELMLRMLAEGPSMDTDLRLWRYATRTSNDGLPSWILDWRRSCCPQDEASLLEMIGREDLSKIWGLRRQSVRLSWPSPDETDASTLKLPSQIVNYVAVVLDLTWPLQDFLAFYNEQAVTGSSARELGHAAFFIHSRRRHQPIGGLLGASVRERVLPFKPSRHTRRLAILGCAGDCGLALVPASTAKGDLVVITAPEMLPIILSPRQPGTWCQQLFESPDLYETTVFDAVGLRFEFLWKRVSLSRRTLLMAGMLYAAILAILFVAQQEYIGFILLMLISSVVLPLWLGRHSRSRRFRQLVERHQQILNDISTDEGVRFKLKGPVLVRQKPRSKHIQKHIDKPVVRTFMVQ